jgi:DNA (cytosine-5)-methyltransferase 1
MPIILPSSLHELALFAGAGGGILGGKLLGWRTVCAVEWDAYARDVLVARQNDGCLEAFPVWDDIQTFDGRPWRGAVDVVSGGFPCQDISAAGKGAGIEGERSGMWKHMARVVGEILPRFVLVENSPMLVGRGLAVVLADLAEMGYDAEWGVVGAHHAAAPHKRDRIWIVATDSRHGTNPERSRGPRREAGERPTIGSESDSDGETQCVADAESTRLEGHRSDPGESEISESRNDGSPAWMPCPCCDDWWCNVHEMHTGECPCPEIDEWDFDPYSVCHAAGEGLPNGATEPMGEPGADAQSERSDWWATEPNVGRVAHGVAARVDRLRCLGNGQVTGVVPLAWNLLKPKK